MFTSPAQKALAHEKISSIPQIFPHGFNLKARRDHKNNRYSTGIHPGHAVYSQYDTDGVKGDFYDLVFNTPPEVEITHDYAFAGITLQNQNQINQQAEQNGEIGVSLFGDFPIRNTGSEDILPGKVVIIHPLLVDKTQYNTLYHRQYVTEKTMPALVMNSQAYTPMDLIDHDDYLGAQFDNIPEPMDAIKWWDVTCRGMVTTAYHARSSAEPGKLFSACYSA